MSQRSDAVTAAAPAPRRAPASCDPAVAQPPRTSAFETALRCVLRIPPGPRRASDDQAYRLFSWSIAISATRCLLTYIVVPVLVPLAGPLSGGGAPVGIPLSLLALVFDVRALRRFWLADHRWRRPMTAVYGVVMAMVLGLLVTDVVSLI